MTCVRKGRIFSVPAFTALVGMLGIFSALAAQSPAPAKAKRAASTKPGVREVAPNKAFGSRTAPITMEVFSDFQCPSCRQFYLDTLRPLLDDKDYVPAGKVYLIHRDFPLAIHAYSREAARYANAAARIGKFEPVVAALFDNQPKWSADGNVEGVVASVLTPAELKHVQQLVHSPQVDAAIQQDIDLGSRVPVRQTPTAVITSHGQQYPVVGVVSYPILKRFLDDLLRQH